MGRLASGDDLPQRHQTEALQQSLQAISTEQVSQLAPGPRALLGSVYRRRRFDGMACVMYKTHHDTDSNSVPRSTVSAA